MTITKYSELTAYACACCVSDKAFLHNVCWTGTKQGEDTVVPAKPELNIQVFLILLVLSIES